jgi:O-antigen/teichoic acid export membrane protein
MRMPDQNTKRSLLANSTYIFLIRFFPALATYVAMILILRNADRSFNGVYQQFWVQWQVYNVIACIGIPALFITYPWEKISKLVSRLSGKFILPFIGWLGLISIIFAYNQFQGYTRFYTWFSICFLFISALIAILESYLMSARKHELIFCSSTLYAIIFAVVHWLFIQQTIEVYQLFLYVFAGGLVRCLLLFTGALLLLRNNQQYGAFQEPLKSVRSLWFHLGLYDMLQTIFRWADKFILSALLSSELFAVYFTGTIEVPFLALLLGAVGSAMLMRLNNAETSEGDRITILKESARKLSYIVFPLFFFLVIFRHELFEVVFTNKYAESVPLFLISCMVIPLRACNFTAILQHKGKGRIINTGAVIDLALAVILMYPLYLLWALNGIALAFVISTYVQAWFYLYHTARIMNCKLTDLLPLAGWLKSAVILLVLFIALYYLLHAVLSSFYALLAGGIVTCIMMFVNVLPTVLLHRRLNKT